MRTLIKPVCGLRAGSAVWLATALLHQSNPSRESFSVNEIADEVNRLALTDTQERTVRLHAEWHCVANRPPNDAKLRMLFETADHGRRLFRPGDYFDRQRDGRFTPSRESLPLQYRGMLDWYDRWCVETRGNGRVDDPLLALRGSGRTLWAHEHADVYVDNLRRELQ